MASTPSKAIKLSEEIIVLIGAILLVLWFFRRGKATEKFSWDVFESPQFEGVFSSSSTFKHPQRKKKLYFKREEKCRAILERLTGKSFVKVRPEWLKYPETKRNLELDGYCRELGIGFEYHGAQHYHFSPGWVHKTREDFYKQQKRDRWKKSKCHHLGIRLIEIPYNITDDEIESLIRKKLREALS